MFHHLRIGLNAVNTALMCKIGTNYQYASQTVCAYDHVFRKRSGCVLIGACALIRMNTVLPLMMLCFYLNNFKQLSQAVLALLA